MAGVNARVVLVEDHPIVVDGLTASFRGRPGVEVVGRAGTLAEARELLHTVACDVVLLDLRLPDGSGIQLLREWREAPSGPAFLVLSSFLTPEYWLRARNASRVVRRSCSQPLDGVRGHKYAPATPWT